MVPPQAYKHKCLAAQGIRCEMPWTHRAIPVCRPKKASGHASTTDALRHTSASCQPHKSSALSCRGPA
eukprot:7149070-Alexandrium_andersonii.AAC.1